MTRNRFKSRILGNSQDLSLFKDKQLKQHKVMAVEFGTIVFGGGIEQFSKEPKEGYVKYPTKDGKTYFKKHFTSIAGKLVGLEVDKHPFFPKNPEIFKLTIEGEDGSTWVLTMFSRSQNGSYSDFAKSLISHLPKIKKDTFYKITPYNFRPEESKRNIRGISFKTLDGNVKVEKLTQAAVFKDGSKKEGDIPAAIFTYDDIRESWNVDDTEQLKYLRKVLDKYLKVFTNTFEGKQGDTQKSNVAGATPNSKPVKDNVEEKELPEVDDDDDELPF